MTDSILAAGIIYCLLFGGLAALPQHTLLQPTRPQAALLGGAAGLAALCIGLLGPASVGAVQASPPLVAACALLFGPLGGVAAAVAALAGAGLLLPPAPDWSAAGQAMYGLLLGSVWHALGRLRRIHVALTVCGLALSLPLVLAPWAELRGSSIGLRDWLPYAPPWRFALSVAMLAGAAELLRSRARTLEQLHRREEDLLHALKATGGGRWEWDLRTRRFAYQGAFFHQFGLADSPGDEAQQSAHLSQEAFQRFIAERRHEADQQRLDPYLLRMLQGEVAHFQAEFRLRDEQGLWHWISSRGHAVQRDAGGRVLRLAGMMLDVTELRSLRDALHASETKYTLVYQTLPDPAGITRLSDGQYLDVNPTFEQLFGLPRGQVLGHTSLELGIWADPQERDRLLQALARDREVRGMPMTAYRGEQKIPGLMSASITRIDDEDCLVFVFHNLAQEFRMRQELQAANNLLHQAGRIARLGVWEEATGQGVIYWSDVCCDIHGLPPGTPLPADYVERHIPPAWRERLRAARRASLDTHQPWSLELEIRRADGRQVWVRASGEPIVEAGRVVRMRGVLQDIDARYRATQELRLSEERLMRMFQALPFPLGFTRRSDGTYIDVNPAWERLIGYSRAEALGHTVVDLGIYTPQARAGAVQEAARLGRLDEYEIQLRTRHGAVRTVLQSMISIDIHGEACWLFTVHDITERQEAAQQIREREELLSLTIAAASLGTWDWDLASGMIAGDARWCEMIGLAASGRGKPQTIRWTLGLSADDVAKARQELQRHQQAPHTPFDIPQKIQRADGGERWLRHLGRIVAHDAQGRPARMVGMTLDITSQHTHARELERMAHYDALTELPNRVLLQQRLRQCMEQCQAQGLHLGVVYIDLDGFKPVNDRLGHASGDRLLVMVAQRLRNALRADDCIARLGGDEFVLLLPNLAPGEDCEERLHALMRQIAAPYAIDGETIVVTASVGYTLYPQDDADADTLLRHADQAMYAAKQAGRNCLYAFDARQERAHQTQRAQSERLLLAFERGELALHLQPKVDMRLGAAIGAEALVRWHHPERGLLLPGQFLHLLDDNAQLQAFMGEWVVDQALAMIGALRLQGVRLPISINVAPDQLHRPGFADWLASRLAQRPDIPAHLLQLELTESAALHDIDHVAQELGRLRALGIGIALDDFGTGYSSLTYLRRLPVDEIKLDRSFVSGMAHDAGDHAIVLGVIGLARSLGYAVVAEGVETEAQGLMLLDMGCTLAQGHGVAPAMPVQQLPAWISAWRAPPSWRGQRSQEAPAPAGS